MRPPRQPATPTPRAPASRSGRRRPATAGVGVGVGLAVGRTVARAVGFGVGFGVGRTVGTGVADLALTTIVPDIRSGWTRQ